MFLYINFLLLQAVNREVVCSSILIFCYSKEVDKFCDTNALIVKSNYFCLKMCYFPWSCNPIDQVLSLYKRLELRMSR